MASIYNRPDSRFIWVKFRDPDTGKPTAVSTGVEKKSALANRKARGICAQYTTKELAAPVRRNSRQDFSQWAEAYLREHYADSIWTLRGHILGLDDLFAFWKLQNVRTPRDVNYEIACRFVPWRTTPDPKSGFIRGTEKLPICQNSAWQRYMTFRVLMREAVNRGFCDFNVTRDVRLKKEASKSKFEITTEHEALIEKALKVKPTWMAECWLILMRQGCRITETKVLMERIDTQAMTITFKIKGKKLHTAMLHPDLLPLVEKARKEKRPTLLVAPSTFGCCLNNLMSRKLKLPYSAHCTRVTVITRLIRAGHPVAQVSNFVGHSPEVDRIYQKLKPSDSQGLLSTLARAA